MATELSLIETPEPVFRERSLAILSHINGTIAPIMPRPKGAGVSAHAFAVLTYPP